MINTSREENLNDYLEIGIGCIPEILLEMKTEKADWYHFLILRALTKHTIFDPGDLPKSFKGDFEKMKTFWLQWGKEKEFI